jgi:hypothetical protein
MGTSFLYVFIIQQTEAAYIKNTLQVCDKRFIQVRLRKIYVVYP